MYCWLSDTFDEWKQSSVALVVSSVLLFFFRFLSLSVWLTLQYVFRCDLISGEVPRAASHWVFLWVLSVCMTLQWQGGSLAQINYPPLIGLVSHSWAMQTARWYIQLNDAHPSSLAIRAGNWDPSGPFSCWSEIVCVCLREREKGSHKHLYICLYHTPDNLISWCAVCQSRMIHGLIDDWMREYI